MQALSRKRPRPGPTHARSSRAALAPLPAVLGAPRAGARLRGGHWLRAAPPRASGSSGSSGPCGDGRAGTASPGPRAARVRAVRSPLTAGPARCVAAGSAWHRADRPPVEPAAEDERRHDEDRTTTTTTTTTTRTSGACGRPSRSCGWTRRGGTRTRRSSSSSSRTTTRTRTTTTTTRTRRSAACGRPSRSCGWTRRGVRGLQEDRPVSHGTDVPGLLSYPSVKQPCAALPHPVLWRLTLMSVT
ncbi:salivary glue protein Sgs-3-like isoform X2 [Gallus gallus]|uniref:salivary glue protein Sgs-3-like isoform X2 n=1 Tax=Gallus gallus TaxID=9031 RepID=UPI001F015E8D|nr:salivary glue protein Sgs-3-like isoform X2 [Gallus gallus]